MRTPKEYSDNLKQGIVTKEMLVDCLYSVNKRAKNARDKARELRKKMRNYYFFDRYNSVEQYEAKRDSYYQMKEILLSKFKPTCIHKELQGYERIRIYDYEGRKYTKALKRAVWINSYFDHEYYRRVYFCDVEKKNAPKYAYYLYYDLGDHSFHTPITPEQLSNYPDLKIVEIDTLQTIGRDVTDLVSMQFVKKVIAIITQQDQPH